MKNVFSIIIMNISFIEALKILNIEDFESRIFHSNSHGELFHLMDYSHIAEASKAAGDDISWFRPWFLKVVDSAEKNWDRPESVFQHMPRILLGNTK